MPRLQLADPETAPPETQPAYEEIRRNRGGMLFTDRRSVGFGRQIMLSVRSRPGEPRTR